MLVFAPNKEHTRLGGLYSLPDGSPPVKTYCVSGAVKGS